MKEISILFQNKRTLLGLALLGVLITTTYNIQENSGKIKRLSTFESGMQTCFSRVNQTYTAKLLDDSSSQYLSQNFQGLTEECFAESISSVEENFKVEMANSLKKLSTLASNVHWFHEDLLAPSGIKSLSNGEGRDIGSRFEKIENTKDEVLDETETMKTKVTGDLNSSKNIFYATSTLLVVLMVLEYLANTKRKISNNAREIEAEKELQDNGGIHSVKLGEIVRLALEQNDLKNCAKLFNNFYIHTSFEKTVKGKNKALENLAVPTSKVNANESRAISAVATSSNIDKIWNDDSIGVAADMVSSRELNLEAVNLDQSISKVVDHLAEKLFSKGVQVDIKVDEKINVMGVDEAIEQIVYHALTFAINNSSDKNNAVVTLSAIKLGDIVAIDITNTGTGFHPEVVRGKAGLIPSDKQIDLDLQICSSLTSEVNGKIQLDNKINQNGEISGARIKVILKTAEGKTTRLVDLKKGSKKDLMAQLSNSNV